MVSHQHKCVFIHISKCAGTTVEQAFGVKKPYDAEMGYGWDDTHKLHLQHATPSQMIASGLLTRAQWETYYKFVIVRNPWARSYSDYAWVMQNAKVYGSFKQFIDKEGPFGQVLNEKTHNYMGDHLYTQYDYFHLDGEPIAYDCVIKIEAIKKGFAQVINDLKLPQDFFDTNRNINNKKLPHYSYFYTPSRKKKVDKAYKKDIEFLQYDFVEKRRITIPILSDIVLAVSKKGKLNLRLKYPYLAHKWGAFKNRFTT